MDFNKLLTPLVLALAAGSFSANAVAQWQWIDKDGRKVYSDRSPPADIQEKSILKRPPGAARTANAAEASVDGTAAEKATAVAAFPKASAPKLSGKDKELEARKKKAEDEEAAKKKVEDEKIAKTKAENCDRAKTRMTTLQSGVRVVTLNSNGEREVLDDAKRTSEVNRTQEVIDAACK